ncbi:hypothetical protein ABPG73_017180, partial [Tetrahymena malaccensis]
MKAINLIIKSFFLVLLTLSFMKSQNSDSSVVPTTDNEDESQHDQLIIQKCSKVRSMCIQGIQEFKCCENLRCVQYANGYLGKCYINFHNVYDPYGYTHIEGSEALRDGLEQFSNLIDFKLILEDINIGPRQMEIISEGIKCLKKLKTLVLDIYANSEIGELGCQGIGKALSNLVQLEELQIIIQKWNKIKSKGAIQIGQGIRNLKKLQKLNVQFGDDNFINMEGIKGFFEGVQDLNELKEFYFDYGKNNYIGEIGFCQFGQAIQNLKKLQKLEIIIDKNNKINSSGIAYIQKGFQESCENLANSQINNEEYAICDDKIIKYLNSKNIQYSIDDYEIQLGELNMQVFNLEISDCYVNKTLILNTNFSYEVNNIVLTNLISNQTSLIKIKSNNQIEFNNILVNNSAIIGNSNLIEIESKEDMLIDKLSCVDSRKLSLISNSMKINNLYIINNKRNQDSLNLYRKTNMESLKLYFDHVSINLKIGHIKLDERNIIFTLSFVNNIQNITIDKFDLNVKDEKMILDIDFIISISGAQYVQISNLNFTSDSNVLQNNLIAFDNVKDIKIISFYVENILFESCLIKAINSDTFYLEDILVRNCFYKNNLISLEKINLATIYNSSFILDYNSSNFNYFQPLSRIDNSQKANKMEWLKAYNDIDDSRSLITMHNFISQFEQIINLNIENVFADFGGFDSRFISVYSSIRDLKINKCSFNNMKSHQNGGCLRFYVLNTLDISSSNFTYCKTDKFGGAIFAMIFQSIQFNDLNLENNSALFGGGIAIDQNDPQNIFQNLNFKNNTSAYFDNDLFNYKTYFQVSQIFEYIPNYFQQNYLLRNVSMSGQKINLIPGSIYVLLIDLNFFTNTNDSEKQKEQQLTTINNIFIGNLYDFYNPGKQQYSQQEINQFLNYELNLKEFKNNESYILFQPNSGLNQFEINFLYGIHLQSNLKLSSADCVQGQQKVQINSLDTQRYMCKYCENMSANYRSNLFECQQCDSQLFSQCYLNYTLLNQGYWRQSLQIDKRFIYKCQSTSQQSCIGGSGFGNELCSEGRIGNECSACDETSSYWNATYTSSSLYSSAKSQINNDKYLICDEKIIEYLDSKNIQYNLDGYEIQLGELKFQEFNLEISDCHVNKTLVLNTNIGLEINDIALTNIVSDLASFIKIQSQNSTQFNNILVNNSVITGQQNLIEIVSKENILIHKLSCADSRNINLIGNSIKINNLYILSNYGYEDSLNLYSNSDIFIENMYSAHGYSYKYKIQSKSSIKVKNIFFESQDLSYFLSQSVLIEDLIIGTDHVFFSTFSDSAQLNQFYQIKQISLMHGKTHIKSLNVQFDHLCLNLKIDHIKLGQSNKKFFLSAVNIQNITINKFDLNIQGKKKVEFNDNIISIISAQNVQISNLNFTSASKVLKNSLFSFDDVKKIKIKSFYVENILFDSFLIKAITSDTFYLEDVRIKNCFYKTNLISLERINLAIIQNSSFILDYNSSNFNYFQPLSRIDKNQKIQKMEWLKAYESIDGSRSLIIMQKFENQLQFVNLNIENVFADFGGFDSRFISVYNSVKALKINKCSFHNMKSHQNGGCLRFYVLNTLEITSSNFTYCKSDKFGGAIFAMLFQSIHFNDLNLENNSALFGGGIAIDQNDPQNIFQNLNFKNNTSAYFDNDLFNYKTYFQVSQIFEYIPNYFQQNYLLRNVSITNQQINLIPGSIYVLLIDLNFFKNTNDSKKQKEQPTTINNIFIGNLYDFYNPGKQQYSQQDISQFLNYEINLKEFKNNESYILFQPNSGLNQFEIYFLYGINLLSNIKFSSSDCVQGQQKVQFNTLDTSKYMCKYCENMSANYRSNLFECQQCDSQLFSQCYLNYTLLNQGYWRQSLQIDKRFIYKCQSTSQQSCIGGSGFGNELCSEGRIGNECSACDENSSYWNATYTSSSLYSCIK